MLILTTIYIAKSEPARNPTTGEIIEKKVYDLKDDDRKMVSVYQGTNRLLPGSSKHRL